jgi:hypothetical protein
MIEEEKLKLEREETLIKTEIRGDRKDVSLFEG